MSRRLVFALFAALWSPTVAPAQIVWNFTYSDPAGIGFNDPTVPAGESLTLGQLRRNTLTAATAYLGGVVDGRGTVNIAVNASNTATGQDALASFGPNFQNFSFGNYQNGGIYQAARVNRLPFAGPAGVGEFNFASDRPYNYAGQSNPINTNAFDLTTIAIHELMHGLGFLSLTNPDGSSAFGGTAGSPATYAGFDRYLQAGTGSLGTSRLFRNTLGEGNFGSFIGPASAFTSGNASGSTTNLYFGGPFAREVFGGPVPIYAPSDYRDGSSTSHVVDAAAVMNPFIDRNDVKRFQLYERAMLLDIGWNVFNWSNTTGNWGDGLANATDSRWRTDQGVVRDNGVTYNTNANPAPAPVLPPSGQTTSDLVFNFGGNGAAGYTSTNTLGTIRLSRVNLTNAGSGTATVADGTLLFGLNSDGTNSVLAPQVRQQGSGPAVITSAVQIPAGVNPTLPRSLAVVGTGTGGVTLSGGIAGTGGLQKEGPFTLTVAGPTTYTGPTVVVSGPVVLTGSGGLATSPTVTVGLVSGTTAGLDVSAVTGGFTLAAGQTLRGAGAVTGPLAVGPGTLQGGTVNAASGTLSVTGSVTVAAGSTVRAAVGAGSASTQVAVAGAFDRAGGGDVFALALQPDAGLTLTPFAPVVGPWAVVTFTGTNLPAGTFTAGGDSPLTLSLTNGLALTDWSATVSGAGLTVNSFTPVPEPATVLLVGVLGLGAWRCRRPTPTARTFA